VALMLQTLLLLKTNQPAPTIYQRMPNMTNKPMTTPLKENKGCSYLSDDKVTKPIVGTQPWGSWGEVQHLQ